MHRGEMVLKIVLDGKFVDIHIEEGQILMLPKRIPHSPQRFKNTIGLVIERERLKNEFDSMRWYVQNKIDDDAQILYEEYFHCYDLGTQLKPVIERYEASEQKRTNKPIPNDLSISPPITPSNETQIPLPFNLKDWIVSKNQTVQNSQEGFEPIFLTDEVSMVFFSGSNSSKNIFNTGNSETWIWQLKSTVEVSTGSNSSQNTVNLNEGDCVLIPQNSTYRMYRGNDSQGLTIKMK